MMRNKEFSETERVIVASEGDKIIGYCTFAMKDELPDDVKYTPFHESLQPVILCGL